MSQGTFVGEGYYEAPNEKAQESEMKINIDIGGEYTKIMLSENRPYGWEKLEDINDREGTRTENLIIIKTEEAISLAKWILEYARKTLLGRCLLQL